MQVPERPTPPPASLADLTRQPAWDELLHQMQELHAQLEYLRLLLRLQQQPK